MNYVDDSALINLKIALIIAEAEELPPFLPKLVINGVPFNFDNSSFDSGAQMNPTGIPMINAGFTIPSFTISITSINAVGAFPMATIPPSMSSFATLMET